jgi:hypothetical protein
LLLLLNTMTERNFKQELVHSCYYDMEDGHDSETIDYDCLIGVITELCDRIEQLESEVKILNRKLTEDTFEVIKND